MECNKDEAMRAKEIAEKKFAEEDVMGAKWFALKAHTLYPTIEGLSLMMATLDIHISAEGRLDGGMDWYEILSVNASADEETVKKRYKKLALVLHPDKNKSIGATGAFQLVSEAWTRIRDRLQRASKPGRDPSVPNTNNDASHQSAKSTTSNAKTQKKSASHAPHS